MFELTRLFRVFESYGELQDAIKVFTSENSILFNHKNIWNHVAQENTRPLSTILLVEDEFNIAKLFKYNLTKAGFRCEVASNGREGLELAEKLDRI